ncbi:MAG: hypothetical protein K6T66_07975 [Peptococcaceae bacterium]|nr:hypothetical protein [Peptococcaceae bacterium]
MAGLWVLAAALACWLGYTLYRAYRDLRAGREEPQGLIYLLMGNQADAAEWFLRNIYRSEGILAGRLAVAVEAEGPDDTAGIVEILSRVKGFARVDPGNRPGTGEKRQEMVWFFDLRGMNACDLLRAPLNTLIAL